ncbi:unnamed protein product [Clonostachys rosea]|uniref:Transcription factor domain-containing protein n=1 Tax=Bionectria ochroleuca TaxID=29856 RepID=A0ABY6USX3_BIOOC|nr:unnamed protein product [Clonostachys rosea]
MTFQFIDNSFGIDRSARKLIRSHASKGHKVGKKRPSHLAQLRRRPTKAALVKPLVADINHDPELHQADSSGLIYDSMPPLRLPVGDFMTFPGELSARSRCHVRNFLCQIMHSIMSDDLGGRIDTRVPVRSLWIQNTFTNEAYFHSNVAFAIAIFEPEAARSGADPEILRHFSRSLHLVNERLSGQYALENSTLIAIIGLSQFERVQDKYEEALVHVQGLNRLALLRGGIAGFRDDPALMQKLFRADLEIALYFGTATTFRAEDLPSQTVTLWLRSLYKKDRQSYYTSQKMTLGLDDSLQASFLDLMSLAAFVSGRTPCPMKLQIYPFHDMIIFLGFRLLEIRPLDQAELTTTYESLMHLALIGFLTTFLRGLAGRASNFMAITSSLRKAIHEATIEEYHFQKLVVWASLIGGHVIFNQDDECWLIPRLSEVSRALNLNWWGDVEVVLMDFPWIPSIHNKAAKRLWNMSQEVCFENKNSGKSLIGMIL